MTAACGGGGDELRWLRPVRPGDTPHGSLKRSRSCRRAPAMTGAGCGFQYTTYNQRDEAVLSVCSTTSSPGAAGGHPN